MKRAKNTKSGHFIWLMTTLYQFLKKENGERAWALWIKY